MNHDELPRRHDPLTFGNAIAVAELMRPNAAVGLLDERPPELRALRDADHPTCPYYRFLYAISHLFAPIDAIEIGTYVGTSAAHLAHGTAGKVVTIDSNPDAKAQVDALGMANITAVTMDSTDAKEKWWDARFDVLFIDGNHTFNQAWGEYFLYRQLVLDGGLILFDDVNLEMDGDEMNVMWDLIPEPKHRADWLHATGFGIVQKVDKISVSVPSWAQAMKIAKPMIEARRKPNPR